MDILRSMHSDWLSNTYLVVDPNGSALMIDAGGPTQPLLERISNDGLKLEKILITHHHYDHVCELDLVLKHHPSALVYAHPLEGKSLPVATEPLKDHQRLELAGLQIEVIHTPGHTAGMVAFLINSQALFTGDTLFKGSVGGLKAPGHTDFADLKNSVMQRLMSLPPQTQIYPGHADPTSVEQEWEHNPFVRLWRGLDAEAASACKVAGKSAELVLLGGDYDGGHKAWIRWPGGSDDIVPGSQISQ